jgi:hypothetical protein
MTFLSRGIGSAPSALFTGDSRLEHSSAFHHHRRCSATSGCVWEMHKHEEQASAKRISGLLQHIALQLFVIARAGIERRVILASHKSIDGD